jgi:hypothetical protein
MISMVPLAAMVATMGFTPPAPAHVSVTAEVHDVSATAEFYDVSATAEIYDQDSELLATGRFDADGDAFTVTKRSAGTGRPYLEYRYVRIDGTLQTGTHQGATEVGAAVRFPHDFGEGRRVTFRVCVTGAHGFNPCSGTDDGENWTIGIA